MAQSENKQEMQQDLTEHTETSPTDVQGDLTKTQISGSDHATEPTEPVSVSYTHLTLPTTPYV